MIIYFYLLITLKILTVESSSIRSGNLKNDLVSLLSSRTDLGRKDSNSLKIISQEPFIIQLGVNNGSENVRIKDIKDESRERQERKKKRPAKRRLSKLKSLRKKHRIRRDVKASDYKKTSAGDERKYNQTDRLITDEVAKNLLVNITSKRLEQGNTIKRKELFQALTQAINETQQEIKQRNSTEEDIDRQIYGWLKTQVDTKQSSHHHHQPISTSNSTPFVRMVHQLPRKTDKNQPKQTYKDLMADRDRLEQKIKSLKNLVNSNDTKLTDDGTRVRRKSELDKVNKMAKMFLTLSAVNGINDRKKFKCKEEEDDDGGDLWAEERKRNPLKRTSSTNEERYKVKKWIEHLKSKRSSRSCPCQNGGRGEDETDVFPLELKLSKDPSLRDFGENSEESSEGYRGRFLDYPRTRSGFYKPRNPINYEDPDNKLSVLSRRGRKFDLPFEDLEVYRSRAKQILQNAEEILDRIKEEEEKRRNTPTCLANHLKELTSKIQGDPRNSENDLIRVLHKALGWNPLTKPEGPNEGAKDGEGSFLDGLKWSIMDPYEKAKALTEENTRQLSSYLLRNLGKIGGQSGEQPEQQVQESKPKEPAADENTQIYQGQVPQDKDSVLLFGDLRKENDPNQPEQGTDVTLTPMEPEIKDGLMATDTVKEPIKDKIKEILEEQGKKIEEFAEKQSEGEESSHEQPESNKKYGSDETKSVPMEPYEKSNNKYHTEGDYEEVINQDEGVEATKHEAEDTKVEALNPKESDEKGEDEVGATEGKDNSEGEDDPTDTTQDDKVEAANSREDSKKTDDEVEALKSKDNSEGENSTDLNQDKVEAASDEGKDDNVEAMNPKENREDDEKEEVEAIENRDNSEGNEDPGNVNEDDKVEARNSKESPDQTDGLNPEKVETAEDKDKSERNEDSVDIKQDDKVQAVNSGENSENTDDEVEAPQVRYNSEGDEDPTDTDQDDKVEGQNLKGSSEKSEDEDMETIEGRNNTEGDKDTTDINEEDKVEGIRSRGNSEDTEDEEVEAVEGKENDEDEDPTEISEDDQVEGKNSRTSNEKTDDEDVEAIEDRNDTEGDEDPTEISEDDKVEAKENLENDEELTEPNEQVEASKPLESLKKNFENVDSDEKTEDYKNKDEEVKLENEKERSSEDGDTETRQTDDSGEETDDFINRETPKATSIEDEETQQTQDENDVIGSPHLSKSEEQEDQKKSDVTGTSDPENSEISKLNKEEDLTVAEPGPTSLEESSEVKPKDNEEDENTDKESQEKGNEGIVAAENTEPKKESNEDNKDEEQTPEKDLTAAEHSTYSQENKSEESDDPQTGKTSNTDEDSDVKERDDNDLITSKHLSKAKGQLEETTEELKDNNDTDDNLTKERVSKTDDITPTEESTESESSSKENYDDNDQVGSENPGKLVSTENDKSKSLESHEGANVPDDKDSKIVSVPENHDKTLDAESRKTDGEDAVRAGLAKVIDGILGKEESWPNEEKEDDSKNDMIQSAPTTDESPTNEDIVEQPNETDDETSRETKPLLTWGKKEEQDQNTDPKSANTSDELTKSSEHDPESTSRTNIVNDDDWSVETAIQEKIPKLNKYKYISELGSNPMEDNSESEENFDYENLPDETLRAAEPIQDNRNIESSGELQNEENLGGIHSQPKTGKTVKLSVPRSVGDVIKDLNDGKIKYDEDMSSLDPEKIDYFIGKIDKAEQDEQAHENSQEVDCRKECACADEIDTRSRKIGRYEIVKDILHWMKDLQINRVLSDD